MRKEIINHVLRINLLIKKLHVCKDCQEGFWQGIGIESKWDWFHLERI